MPAMLTQTVEIGIGCAIQGLLGAAPSGRSAGEADKKVQTASRRMLM